MSRLTVGRRRLLSLLGLGAVAGAPVFRAGVRHAHAQETIPQRLIAMWHANGWRVPPRDSWAYDADAPAHGRADDTLFFPGKRRDASYALADVPADWPDAVSPLQRHASDLLFIDGLTNRANANPQGHAAGGMTFMTGAYPIQNFGASGGVSMDRFLAARNATRFASIDMGVGQRNITGRISHSGPAQPNDSEVDPLRAYQRTFEDFVDGPDSEARQAELMEIRRRRASILDYSARELIALRPDVPSADRPRLEAHAEAIRSMERRIDAAARTHAMCGAPTAPRPLDPRRDEDTPEISSVMLDIIAAAYACDLTRMTSMFYGYGTTSFIASWVGASEMLHAMSHFQAHDPRHAEYTATLNWIAEQVASLLDRLAAIPESDGQSLLHHSLMVWSSDNGSGARHTVRDIPFILAGQAGGRLETGRTVHYPLDTTHNGLLISIAGAFGEEVETFGDARFCNGPLPGLFR